jgi:hypothetical protein
MHGYKGIFLKTMITRALAMCTAQRIGAADRTGRVNIKERDRLSEACVIGPIGRNSRWVA